MLKERKNFLFKDKQGERNKVKDIFEENRVSFFKKNENKSKWKLTQLFNRNANKKIDKIFFPVYLVPYIGYFSQRFSSNETVINFFKIVSTNSDFKMTLVCLLISSLILIFCMSYLCVSLQNYLIGKIANPLKIFKKKEKIIKELFDEQPISLNLLKEISKKIGEQKTSEILSLYNGVISNNNIKDILNDNFEDIKDVEEKFKQISSCFFIKEKKFEPKEEITIVEYERKETTDEMIERLERELAERGVDVNGLLKQREKEKQTAAYLMNKIEEEKQKREVKLRRKSEKRPQNKGRKDQIFVLEGIIDTHVKLEVEHLKTNKNLDDYDQLVLKNILSLESRGFDYISHSVKKEMEKLNACSNETLSIILRRIGSGEIINRVLKDYEINTVHHNVEDDKDKKSLIEINQESLTVKLTREKKAELEFLKKKESPDSTDKEILRIVSEMEGRGFDYIGYAVQKEIEKINKVNKEIAV